MVVVVIIVGGGILSPEQQYTQSWRRVSANGIVGITQIHQQRGGQSPTWGGALCRTTFPPDNQNVWRNSWGCFLRHIGATTVEQSLWSSEYHVQELKGVGKATKYQNEYLA